jgi:hypothetical protein
MSSLNDVKSYMEFWGWTNGGSPGSVKYDAEHRVIAQHGDAQWIDDVERACDTAQRIYDRARSLTSTESQSK